MRIHEIINEGYKEAQTEFGAVIDPAKALELINQYKVLCQRNQVTGQERNIDYWRKQGVDAFAKFVGQKLAIPSKTEIKRSKIPGKHIDLVGNSEWQIVIPLDKESSCFHGKGSDWCTTKPNASNFEQYFYDKSVTLIYLLQKQTGKMWAIACYTEPDELEMFDQQDNLLSAKEFKRQTGINPEELRDLALSDTHATPIHGRRAAYRESCIRAKQLIADMGNEPNPEIEKELIFNKNAGLIKSYFSKINDTNSLSDQMKLLVLGADGNDIQRFENPSEKMKMTAVRQNGYAIQRIKNPSLEVRLEAVRQNGHAIQFLENPSLELQLEAVRLNGRAIRHIKNPSEEVQLCAVRQNGHAIEVIDNPSEEALLIAVQQNGWAIQFIKNPSMEVQLAAVQQNGGSVIRCIKNPYEAVQLAAVRQDGHAIRYIKNPSMEVQLAAVQQDSDAIHWIKNPSAEIQLIAILSR